VKLLEHELTAAVFEPIVGELPEAVGKPKPWRKFRVTVRPASDQTLQWTGLSLSV
jgi:hypothetical protein